MAAEKQALGRERPREVEVGHLPVGVDAGIRAPGRVSHHAAAVDPGQRLFEDGLDGARGVPLQLPAVEERPDVGHVRPVSHTKTLPHPA